MSQSSQSKQQVIRTPPPASGVSHQVKMEDQQANTCQQQATTSQSLNIPQSQSQLKPKSPATFQNQLAKAEIKVEQTNSPVTALKVEPTESPMQVDEVKADTKMEVKSEASASPVPTPSGKNAAKLLAAANQSSSKPPSVKSETATSSPKPATPKPEESTKSTIKGILENF